MSPVHRLGSAVVGIVLAAALISSICISGSVSAQQSIPAPAEAAKGTAADASGVKTATAIFAAGCFWCVEADFDKVPGVLKTTPGYTGGHTKNPTYEEVATGLTGHTEALQVVYDPKKVTYQKLLAWYWLHVDPTDGTGQFCDRGNEYRPVIFVDTPEQRRLAEASKTELEKSGLLDKPIAVKIVDASTFTPAEPEHHDFYLTHPWRYMYYRWGCGRDEILKRIWHRATG